MKCLPTSVEYLSNKIGFTYAEIATLLDASERFVQECVGTRGLRVRLLRPGLPRVAIFDFEDWLARQMRQSRWPQRGPQLRNPGTGGILRKTPVATRESRPEAFLTYGDVAIALSIGYETVRNLVRDDGLPVIFIASRVPRVDGVELERWLRTRPFRSARCPNPATRGRGGSMRLRQAAFVDLPGGGWPETTGSLQWETLLPKKP
jgi:hypothetical protein